MGSPPGEGAMYPPEKALTMESSSALVESAISLRTFRRISSGVSFFAAFAFAALTEGTLIFLYRAHPTVLEGSVAKILSYIALFRRMDDMVYGIFDITAIVYYVSIAALFLFFTVQVIEKRRWN